MTIMFQRRRKSYVVFANSLVVAAIAFSAAARSPRFEMLHTVDILLLFFSGASFGAGLVGLIRTIWPRQQV
jgi:hypothetical protein